MTGTDDVTGEYSDAREIGNAAPFEYLHPLSIVLKSLSAVGRNIVLIGILYFSLFDRNIGYTMLATLVILAAIVGITALVWSRFTWQIGEREVRIKSGLLNRNNRSIPFDRIQDVSLEQKLISRLLGLTTVRFETGSGAGEDGELNALKLEDGEAIRDIIRDYKSGQIGENSTQAEPLPESERPPLFAMDNRRILIAGLFNFSFILLAILGTIAQNLDFLIPEGFFDPRNWIETLTEQDAINGLSMAARVGGVVAAIFSLITVGIVSGIVRTYVREYGFRLDLADTGTRGFRRRRGLFTLTDMVMPIHRVQAAVIQSGPVRERFGWYHLKFQSLAGDPSGETDHSAAPCARQEEMAGILDETPIMDVPENLAFQKVNPAFWWRNAILALLLLSAVAIGNGLFVHPGFFAILLLALPVIALMFLNWRKHQYALSEDQLFVRSGWWRRRLTILPVRRVQTVDISQSPLDHPLELADLTIGVAGGSSISPLKIQAIPVATAKALRARLV